MALQRLHFSKPNNSQPCISNPPFLSIPTHVSINSIPTRRTSLLIPVLLSLLPTKQAHAFDFSLTVPDQTVEEAESGIRFHAQSLLQVKETLELESWKEAQKELRRSSALLKQDLYTIIQSKPPSQRPQLRNLYSVLFNSVSQLDYAARDKDVTRVTQCYDNIVVALNQFFSLLY
ncbi:psbQ-like protein 3, chloroplastic [Heracleum sosnowskyi]|uniref:PsbQ-like protein 3, chloroplastic n=1 Tax=Heracleum sosnowskyi TaxID=360622 RepID=A0AAD8MWN1_9APIA|nr:psbQ-like protein 3, chloroplastic [Heracleum sosnowskyi]